MNDRKYLVLPALLSIILLRGCATYPTPYGGGGYGFNPNAVTGAVTGAAIGTVAGDPGATVLHPSTMVHLHRCITIPIIHATTVTAVGNIGVRTPRTRVREGANRGVGPGPQGLA